VKKITSILLFCEPRMGLRTSRIHTLEKALASVGDEWANFRRKLGN
jgi:hypothetical protein